MNRRGTYNRHKQMTVTHRQFIAHGQYLTHTHILVLYCCFHDHATDKAIISASDVYIQDMFDI